MTSATAPLPVAVRTWSDEGGNPRATLSPTFATAEALLSALRAELAPDIVASRDDALLLGVVSQLEAALYPAEVPPCASRT